MKLNSFLGSKLKLIRVKGEKWYMVIIDLNCQTIYVGLLLNIILHRPFHSFSFFLLFHSFFFFNRLFRSYTFDAKIFSLSFL